MRRAAWIALALCATFLALAEMDHVRCVTVSIAAQPPPEPSCATTYGPRLALPLGILALASGAATLLLARRDGTRVVVALAAALLVVPALIVLSGWASVGFHVQIAQPQPDGGTYCTGPGAVRPLPIYLLSAPTCLRAAEAVRLGLLAVAACLAVGAVVLARRSWAFAAAGLVLVAFAADLLAQPLYAAGWALPLMAAGLLAAGARRLPPAPA